MEPKQAVSLFLIVSFAGAMFVVYMFTATRMWSDWIGRMQGDNLKIAAMLFAAFLVYIIARSAFTSKKNTTQN